MEYQIMNNINKVNIHWEREIDRHNTQPAQVSHMNTWEVSPILHKLYERCGKISSPSFNL